MNCNQRQLGGNEVGWTARYFLRRYALARKSPKSSEATAYSNAIFEVTLVAVLMPCLAVFSCVLVTSIKWAPAFAHTHPKFSPKAAALVIGFLAIGTGQAWFRRRFRRLVQTPDVWTNFDTDKDRLMAFWQKVIILSICGAVIPLLAVAVTLWNL